MSIPVLDPAPAGRNRPRLVASDLDGTLLAPDGRISPTTLRALRRLHELDIDLVIATARPPAAFDPLRDLPVPGTVIAQNGAVLIDHRTGIRRTRGLVDRDGLRELVARLESALGRVRVAVQSVLDDGERYVAERGFPSPPSFRYEIAPRSEVLRVPATRALVQLDRSAYEWGLHALIEGDDRITVTRSTSSALLEISGAGITKASALVELAAAWVIDASDVIAFGDMPNDIEMLSWAGWGVAMDGAPPEVIASADDVASGNVCDGVARYLDRLLGLGVDPAHSSEAGR